MPGAAHEHCPAALSIDSPSGFTDQVVREAEQIARDHGYAVRRTNKGNLVVSVPGREKGKRVGLCAHIDTLGSWCAPSPPTAC